MNRYVCANCFHSFLSEKNEDDCFFRKCGQILEKVPSNQDLYRKLMWINEEEGYIAFDVRTDFDDIHKYYEYLKFFHDKPPLKER